MRRSISAEDGFERHRKLTRREKFLDGIDQVAPWKQIYAATRYVLNNPASLTDPSGHLVLSLGAMLLVAAQETIKWYVAAAVLGAGGFALKVVLHGTVGGVAGALQGGRFGHGFAGRPGLWVQQRTVVAATTGGMASRIIGGKFATGTVVGAVQPSVQQ